jgi:hypothetical protein
VAYRDYANGDKAVVMVFNGSSWVAMGSPGLSGGLAAYTSLALDSHGWPYVAYMDAASGNKATVMKYVPWSTYLPVLRR